MLTCWPHLLDHSTLIGPPLSLYIPTLLLTQSSLLLGNRSAAHTVWSDGGHNLHLKHFLTSLNAGVFCTNFLHQSNGKVEAAVKSMKKLLQHSWNGRALDDEQFCRSLLQYRNTLSRKDGLSPIQKLFGHPVQDILPAHRRSFLPQWQLPPQEAIQQVEDISKLSAAYYNLHAHTLPDIHVGSHVAVQNPQSRLWDIYGIVTEIGPHRRYYIKTTGGRVLIRNRHFLHRCVPVSLSKEPE